MSNPNLPTRPNLEHLRAQAKDLLSSYRSGDPQAVEVLREFPPKAAAASKGSPPSRSLTLANAQFAVARKHGFPSWPRLVHYVEQLRDLEGTWRFETLEIEGNPVPSEILVGSRLIIDGSLFKTLSAEARYIGNFDIDVEATPHSIDIHFFEGPEKGNSNYGIYELDGDALRICLDMTGKGRPRSFGSTAGTGCALETLRRRTAASDDAEDAATPSAEEVDPPSGPVSLEGFGATNSDLERLEGRWAPVDIVLNGQELPPVFIKNGLRVGRGAETTVSFGEQIWMQAQTRVDISVNPMTIDYLHTQGPTAGLVQLGILEWVGEDVRFCVAGPGRARPTEFASPRGRGRTLSVWRRTR